MQDSRRTQQLFPCEIRSLVCLCDLELHRKLHIVAFCGGFSLLEAYHGFKALLSAGDEHFLDFGPGSMLYVGNIKGICIS